MSLQNTAILLNGISLKDFENLITNAVRKEMHPYLDKLTQPKEVAHEELLTKNEAAIFLKMSLPTISKLVRKGIISCSRIGGSLRFKKSDLEKSLEQTRNRNYRLPGSNSS